MYEEVTRHEGDQIRRPKEQSAGKLWSEMLRSMETEAFLQLHSTF
jgi:hypothetical protein